MAIALTELDKAILLSILVLGRGTTAVVNEEQIISRFPLRQRKNARKAIKKLISANLLIKKSPSAFSLSEDGLKNAVKLLHKGAPLI